MGKITQKMVDNMLKYEDFCIVMTDTLEEEGLLKGTTVFIAGTQQVPLDEVDVYNLRLKMLVASMDKDGHVDSTKFYMVDPSSLLRVSKQRAKKFRRILEKDFKKTEEAPDDAEEAS